MLRRSMLIANLLLSITTVGHSAVFQQNTDITDQLNAAIKNGGSISIPAGNYKIDATKGIIIPSNTNLRLSKNTIISIIPNKLEGYQVFKIINAKNVSISGGNIIGDKYTHLGKTGEWGMGVLINDSQNVSISNISINKMWGDGIYIGSSGQESNYNIKLSNVILDDNRRQGLSIITVNKLRADNIVASNTSGTPPAAGIDIEPNNKNNILKDIIFKNVITKNNQGAGFHTFFSAMKSSINPTDIQIINHTDYGSQYGFDALGLNDQLQGRLTLTNSNYTNSNLSNLCIGNFNTNNFSINFKSYKSDNKNIINKNCSNHKKIKQVRFMH